MRWALAEAEVRLGEGDSVTRFAAGRIDGRAAAGGMAGTLSEAEGKIGAVPLNLSRIAGDWRWAGGALTPDGGLRLTDARSAEHTSEPQALMRISYAVYCVKK